LGSESARPLSRIAGGAACAHELQEAGAFQRQLTLVGQTDGSDHFVESGNAGRDVRLHGGSGAIAS